jgi:hypothetical protein
MIGSIETMLSLAHEYKTPSGSSKKDINYIGSNPIGAT